jgi:hypothetical protein
MCSMDAVVSSTLAACSLAALRERLRCGADLVGPRPARRQQHRGPLTTPASGFQQLNSH